MASQLEDDPQDDMFVALLPEPHRSIDFPAVSSVRARVQLYEGYFEVDVDHIKQLSKDLLVDMELGCRLHAAQEQPTDPPLMLDTFIKHLPSTLSEGVAFGVTLTSQMIQGIRVAFGADGTISEEKRSAKPARLSDAPRGLMDRTVSATALFDTLAKLLSTLLVQERNSFAHEPIPVAFTLSFPLQQTNLKWAILQRWIKGFETGRESFDPAEGMDMGLMLQMALRRQGLPAEVVAVAVDATSALLGAAIQRKNQAPCLAALVLSDGFNVSYVEPKAAQYKYEGIIVNTEVGGYQRNIHRTDVDLCVDSENTGRALEQLVAAGYLGETCRILVLRVWQQRAPPLSWQAESLPTPLAMACVVDATPDLKCIRRILAFFWDWDLDFASRLLIKRLFSLVFERAAALIAAVVAAIAKRTGKLEQKSHFSIALDACPHAKHPQFLATVRKYLRQVVGEDAARFIHLFVADRCVEKGTAVLARL